MTPNDSATTSAMESALRRLQRVGKHEFEAAYYACFVNAEADDPRDDFDAAWLRGRILAMQLWRNRTEIAA